MNHAVPYGSFIPLAGAQRDRAFAVVSERTATPGIAARFAKQTSDAALLVCLAGDWVAAKCGAERAVSSGNIAGHVRHENRIAWRLDSRNAFIAIA